MAISVSSYRLFLFICPRLSVLVALSPFLCPPSIVWLRLEGQWGVARAEWKLIRIWPWMDTSEIAGEPSALFRAPLMIPVFLCHRCLVLHHKKKKLGLTGANGGTACYRVGEDALLGDHEEVKWHIRVGTDVPQHHVYHQSNFGLVCLGSLLVSLVYV